MRTGSTIAGAAAAALFAASAHAGVIYAGPSGAPGKGQVTDSSISLSFNSPAATSSLSFTIDGYLSLDGQNYYEDVFSLRLNGGKIFVGTFNLGGGSGSGQQANVYYNPDGATYTNPTGNGTEVGWLGGKETISFSDVPLDGGTNVLTFTYYSLPWPKHAGFQGLGDEGWGIQQVSVSAVPEPATWAMLLLGFAGLGLAGYRKARNGRAALAVA